VKASGGRRHVPAHALHALHASDQRCGTAIAAREAERRDRPRLERLFNERYEALYGSGSTHSEAGIEVMSISVDAIGSTPKPELKSLPEWVGRKRRSERHA